MASLAEYLQQLYAPPTKVPGFALADIAQEEGKLSATHNLDQRGFDVAGQRLGLSGQQLGLSGQQFGLDRAGIASRMGQAQRDFGFDLSALKSSFGAKGTFFSGGRETAETRLGNTLSDYMGEQNRALSGVGLQEQGLGLDQQQLGLDQTDLGLDRERSNLTLSSGLGSLNLQKIYAANGV